MSHLHIRYHAHGVTPRFCFGHGLSYTSFNYSALVVNSTRVVATVGAVGAATHTVAFTVSNVGRVAGAAVPQLYVTFPASAGEPPRQLKGFTKVTVAAGGQAQVALTLTARDLSVWDIGTHAWVPVVGSFTVEVADSSCDVRAAATLTV